MPWTCVKYGRSLRDHRTTNFVTSLGTYWAEVDEAVGRIRTVDGHDSLLVIPQAA
jgi:hypothetical protein